MGSERLVPMLEKDFYNTLFRVAFFKQTCRNPFGEYCDTVLTPQPNTSGKRWKAFLCSSFILFFLFFFFFFFFAKLVPEKII